MTNPSSDVLERVEALVDAGFATVSRNPSDWEATTAWRHAIRSAVDQCVAHEATIERLSAELERLCAKTLDGDHKRGCEGRQYHCTCEYDNELWLTAEEARRAALTLPPTNNERSKSV